MGLSVRPWWDAGEINISSENGRLLERERKIEGKAGSLHRSPNERDIDRVELSGFEFRYKYGPIYI